MINLGQNKVSYETFKLKLSKCINCTRTLRENRVVKIRGKTSLELKGKGTTRVFFDYANKNNSDDCRIR